MKRAGAAPTRPVEGMALILVAAFLLLAFFSASAGMQVSQGLEALDGLPLALIPPLLVILLFAAFHRFLVALGLRSEQILYPVICLLFSVGLVMIWRLRGAEGAWQQILRGLLPGTITAAVLVARPDWIEKIRRRAVPIGLVGLALPVLTGLFGTVDETGARMALKIGPLPAVQTTEPLKLVVIIFLAWFIARQQHSANAARSLRQTALEYALPGLLFASLAVATLVLMLDYGAVLILALIFIAMLYVGLNPRVFVPVVGIGIVIALGAGLLLSRTWDVPAVIQYRFQAYQNPWSTEMTLINGQPSGVTVAEGPGYQIQQAIYAVIAGGVSGSGLGFGSPDYVPLAYSDYILAAVVEEMGAVIGVAVLILFAVLLLRVFQIMFLLPSGQVFERLLLVGIGTHLFTQVFVMACGTLNLLPVSGVTVPFLSQGGMALLTNLVEIGLVLALTRRQESLEQDV